MLEETVSILDTVLNSSGSVGLDIIDGSDIGPQNLNVEAENGNYLITLGENDGEDYDVRSYVNDIEPRTQQVAILGNLWDASMVCNDQAIVKAIIEEFMTTGDVSRELLR